MTNPLNPPAEYWQERALLTEEAIQQLAQQLVRADPRLHAPLQGWADTWTKLLAELNQKHGTKEQP